MRAAASAAIVQLSAIGVAVVATESVNKPLVYVVDDDPAVRNSLKFSLELEGLGVRTFANPKALLASHDAAMASCLIIDYKMPDMNGLELLSELRRRHIATPAILITSQPSASLQESAARAGVPIVEKPHFSALNERVRDALGATRH
jgi:two-component system response regulator FixJ